MLFVVFYNCFKVVLLEVREQKYIEWFYYVKWGYIIYLVYKYRNVYRV